MEHIPFRMGRAKQASLGAWTEDGKHTVVTTATSLQPGPPLGEERRPVANVQQHLVTRAALEVHQLAPRY